MTEEWKEWLNDKWYREIVHYKLFGDMENHRDADGEPLTRHRRRLVQLKSKPYRLLCTMTAGNDSTTGTCISEHSHSTTKPQGRLVFVERNRKEAFCVRVVEVESILYQSHNCHGHFPAGVLLRTMVRRY